jgi:hypothetical protein
MQTFIPKAPHAPVAKMQPTPGVRMLTLQTYSYESRKPILTALQDAMDRSGCWLLERKVMSHSQTDFVFEVNGRSIVDLYTSLIGAGLELTRASHIEMTNLCSLMKHGAMGSRFSKAQRIVNVKLEVSFLEDIDLKSILVPGAALA